MNKATIQRRLKNQSVLNSGTASNAGAPNRVPSPIAKGSARYGPDMEKKLNAAIQRRLAPK